MLIGRDAILQHKAGDAAFCHPGADVHAFIGDGKAAVAAAGTNDDGRAAGFVGRGQKRREGRNIGVLVAEGARRGFVPERLGLRRTVGRNQRQGQGE